MDNKLIVGDIVVSKLGHDKNKPFIVVAVDNFGFVDIIDGKCRVKEKPKKKNPKHLEKVAHSDDIIEKLKLVTTTNSELNKLIKTQIK